ncbi:MAG TPA: OsmC family protein [Anaerolineaceae bacterium]|nr:OsmC family protein [Anaerolineaceae bacterium]
MEAKVTWHKGLSFSGTADSGYTLSLGGKKSVGGEEDGFLPMEMFLIGLGGCTGMDVISILAKMRQEVTGFEVKIHADRVDAHPKIFSDIMIEYVLTGKNLDPTLVQKAVDLSEQTYCPGQAILSKTAKIDHKITILEA